jgi:hypothetical protein
MVPQGADRSAVEKNAKAASVADAHGRSIGQIEALCVAFLENAGYHLVAGSVSGGDPSELRRLQCYVLASRCRGWCW